MLHNGLCMVSKPLSQTFKFSTNFGGFINYKLCYPQLKFNKMEIDYFKEENELTKKLFDLDEIISFQMKHDIQITREDDW